MAAIEQEPTAVSAHRLRGDLAVILGAASVLADHLEEPDAELARMIVRRTEHLDADLLAVLTGADNSVDGDDTAS